MTLYRDGTTQVAFEPVDFVARLTALAEPAASQATSQPHPLPCRSGRFYPVELGPVTERPGEPEK
jgi:hypothetical protein